MISHECLDLLNFVQQLVTADELHHGNKHEQFESLRISNAPHDVAGKNLERAPRPLFGQDCVDFLAERGLALRERLRLFELVGEVPQRIIV